MTNANGSRGVVLSEEEALATLLRVRLRNANLGDEAFGALALVGICESVAALATPETSDAIRASAWQSYREQAPATRARSKPARAA